MTNLCVTRGGEDGPSTRRRRRAIGVGACEGRDALNLPCARSGARLWIRFDSVWYALYNGPVAIFALERSCRRVGRPGTRREECTVPGGRKAARVRRLACPATWAG